MQKSNWRTVLIMLVALSSAACAYPQNADSPAYLNPLLPAEQRAADLVHRMTVEELLTTPRPRGKGSGHEHFPAT